jgi:hypothetical protein
MPLLEKKGLVKRLLIEVLKKQIERPLLIVVLFKSVVNQPRWKEIHRRAPSIHMQDIQYAMTNFDPILMHAKKHHQQRSHSKPPARTSSWYADVPLRLHRLH